MPFQKNNIPWNKGLEFTSKCYCVDCGNEINRYCKRKRCKSCAAKYRWEHEDYRQKMIKAKKLFYKLYPEKKKELDNKSKEYWSDPQSIINASETKKKFWDEHPEYIERCMQKGAGFGKRSHADDGTFHPSMAQKKCYEWIKNELNLNIRKFGRFDFIIENKIVLEYHPCNWWLEPKSKIEYYNKRRKKLNQLGFKNLNLIIMIDLSKNEKSKIHNEIFKFI